MLITMDHTDTSPQPAPADALALRDVTLGDLARLCGGTLLGEDRPVLHLRPVGAPPVRHSLTYAAGTRSAHHLHESAIVRPADLGAIDVQRVSIIAHREPSEAFFQIHAKLTDAGRYGTLDDARGTDVQAASTAVLHRGVQIGNGVRIGEGAVVFPNTIVGDAVIIAAGAIVGGDGFEVATSGGHRALVPHTGGVFLAPGVTVGSQSCIDRGLFSTFTVLGRETMLDNLVHVAHDVRIGERCTLTACSELSGCAVMEDDVWYAPGSACNQFVRFGRGALVGTGSVVVRDVDPFTLVRGNPARPAGQVCLCRAKLAIGDEWVVRCPSCGREYAAPNGSLTLL